MPSRLKTFYWILVTQTLSLIGSRMTSVGVGIWVYAATGETTPLLLTAFFTELPGMAASSLAGVLVDRWNRRRMLLLADAGQAAGSMLLLLSFSSGAFQIWHLYAVSLLQGAFHIFQGPASDATTTLLVPEDQRERANGLQQMAFPLAGVMAPVLAGLVYSLVGVTGVILVDLATFLLAVLAVVLVHIPQPPASSEGLESQGGFLQEWRGGLRFLRQRRPLLAFVLYLTAIGFLLNGPLELAIPYLLAVTGSETQMGGLLGVMSLGALSGAGLIAVWRGTRPRMYTLLPGLLLTGLMFLALSVARSSLVLGGVLYVLMIPLPIMNALSMSILQLKTPPDLQGRIFSTVDQLGFLGSTASFLVTGPLVDRWLEPAVTGGRWAWAARVFGQAPGAGMGLLLATAGLAILALTVGVLAWPPFRRLEITLADFAVVAEPAVPESG